jgi:hypothetical protein
MATQQEAPLAVGQRGTRLYQLNRWREDALTAFLDDLVRAEENGFTHDQCAQVRRHLELMANGFSRFPDHSILRGSMLSSMERLVQAYVQWNHPEGTDDATVTKRRARLQVLRRRRQKLARVIRANVHVLEAELDLKFLEDQYAAMGSLVKALPDLFKSLAKALETLLKKGK